MPALLALALLPAAVWAAEPQTVGIAVPDWSATALDGTTITQDTYLGRTQVLVFYRGSGICSNSNYTIRGLANSQ